MHLDGDLDLDPVSGSLVDLLGPEGPGGQQVLRSVCPHSPILLAAHWWARVFLPYVSAPLWGDREMGLRRSWREVLISQEAHSGPPPSLTPPAQCSLHLPACVTSVLWGGGHLCLLWGSGICCHKPASLGCCSGDRKETESVLSMLRDRCGQVTPAYAQGDTCKNVRIVAKLKIKPEKNSLKCPCEV